MRILLIDVNCKNGSTGKIVYDLYNGFINDGHNVAICYGRGPLIKGKNIYKFGIDFETLIHAFLTRVTGLTGIYSPVSTLRLLRFIQKFKPDVVHIHELHAYFVNISPLMNFLKKHSIRTVWTFHCEFMYTGKCGHAYDCEKWKNECHKCPQKREYPASLFFDFTRKMFNQKKKLFDGFNNLTIVTPSKWLADRVSYSFLKGKEVKVIFNGIDTKTIFHPRNDEELKKKHGLTDEKIVISVAPDLLSKTKGGRFILELAKMMKGENVKFILIGIKDLSEKFDDNVIALGRTENQIDLATYYSMADVFVICSKKETFSLTSAEALCCGTPLAGFESGAPESIFENPYAMFVPYGDVFQLEKILLLLLNGFNIKEGCTEYGVKKFTKEEMCSKYLEIYRA